MKEWIYSLMVCFLLFGFNNTFIWANGVHYFSKVESIEIEDDEFKDTVGFQENLLSGIFLKNEEHGIEDIRFSAETVFGTAVFMDECVSFKIIIDGEINQLKYEFVNTRDPKLSGNEQNSKLFNGYFGNDRSNWNEDIDCYNSIIYRDIWEKIDLKFYFSEKSLKYEYILHPGSDPSEIKIKTIGGTRMIVNPSTLQIQMEKSSIFMDDDLQTFYLNEPEVMIESSFALLNDRTFGFNVDDYDVTKAIVIDPEIQVSTIIGGTNVDRSVSMQRDREGNILMVGSTNSIDFPFQSGKTKNSDDLDVFIVKFDPLGNEILSCTFFGGSELDEATDMCLDEDGFVYILGKTRSDDMPISDSAFDKSVSQLEAFLLKINPTNLTLEHSTYIGGSGDDFAIDMSVMESKFLLITGYTHSSDFPIKGDVFDTQHNGNADIFVLEFALDGNLLEKSTYIGGSYDDICTSLIIGHNGIYLAGRTKSDDFPFVFGNYDETMEGENDGFLLSLTHDLYMITSSTYFGGGNYDSIEDIAFDRNGDLILTGYTTSPSFPITDRAIQDELHSDGKDGFIARFAPNLKDLEYSSFYGGTGDDKPCCISTDKKSNIMILVETDSTDLPVIHGEDHFGKNDLHLTVFSNNLSSIDISSYYGGSNNDVPLYLDVEQNGDLFIAGYTNSHDFIQLKNNIPAPFSDKNLAYFINMNMNDPPIFVEFPSDITLEHGEELVFEVMAMDLQKGTKLEYSIDSQPFSDIDIDPNTGIIEWVGSIRWFEVPPFIFNVTVEVSDGSNIVSDWFLIKMTYDGLPKTRIEYPLNGTKVPFNGFEIRWTCSKEVSAIIDYDIYIHEKKAFVQARMELALYATVTNENSVLLNDFSVGNTYYWSVVPKENGMAGFCLDGEYSFTVNSPPYFVDDIYFIVNAGENFHKLISVLDNDTYDGSNLSFNLVEGPQGFMVQNRTGMIDWIPTNEQVRMHHVKIQVTDGTDNIMVTYIFDVKSQDIKKVSLFEIILVSIGVSIAILAIVLIGFLRKKIKENEKEEEKMMIGMLKDIDESQVEKIKCDVPLTSTEAHAHLGKGSKSVSYEDLYGASLSKEDDDVALTTCELKNYIKDSIKELEGIEEIEEE